MGGGVGAAGMGRSGVMRFFPVSQVSVFGSRDDSLSITGPITTLSLWAFNNFSLDSLRRGVNDKKKKASSGIFSSSEEGKEREP